MWMPCHLRAVVLLACVFSPLQNAQFLKTSIPLIGLQAQILGPIKAEERGESDGSAKHGNRARPRPRSAGRGRPSPGRWDVLVEMRSWSSVTRRCW